MALSAEDIATLDALLGGHAVEADVLKALRAQLAGLSLTSCDVSDIDQEQPFRDYPCVSVYLVDAADHCWKMTDDPARATGLVVAKRRLVGQRAES
jgi:hypothetical protein